MRLKLNTGFDLESSRHRGCATLTAPWTGNKNDLATALFGGNRYVEEEAVFATHVARKQRLLAVALFSA